MKIIAHRGFSGRFPENTMLAFSEAKALGVDGFELDVQLTTDKKVVVFHDEFLERITDGKGCLTDLTLKGLKKFTIGTVEKIPLLSEILQRFKSGPRLLIELKFYQSNQFAPLIEQTVKLLKKYKSNLCPQLCSFNWEALRYLRKKDKDCDIAVLYVKKPLYQVIKFARQINAQTLSINVAELTKKKVMLAHKNNLQVLTWTVNTKDLIKKSEKMGVDGIITNYPNKVNR